MKVTFTQSINYINKFWTDVQIIQFRFIKKFRMLIVAFLLLGERSSSSYFLIAFGPNALNEEKSLLTEYKFTALGES